MLEEIYITGKDDYKLIEKLLRNNQIRKISAGIYTSVFDKSPEEVIKRNLFQIIAEKFPGSVISHRSAIELQPIENNFFITWKYNDKYEMPGLSVHITKGRGPIAGDNQLKGAGYSQIERAFLENLQISKSSPSKCLSQIQVEEKLEMYLRLHGETYLNQFRDKARNISLTISMDNEFKKLDRIIGALLSTREIKHLESDVARARVKNVPYDNNRIKLFEKLFICLNSNTFKEIPDPNKSANAYKLFAFFESYFSNYVEGTKFKVEDAKKIIDTNTPMPSRIADSHDILGTYKIVSNKNELSKTPNTADEFITLLQNRHKILLEARPEFSPGMFKEKGNQAGNTVFVEPGLVRGTLYKGFEYYKALKEPFAKAAFLMFVIAETHPFNDGNGRIARIFMNAELTKSSQCKIIIVTSFREDYILTLKKLTFQQEPLSYMRMLEKAQGKSFNIKGETFEETLQYLTKEKAFDELTDSLVPSLLFEGIEIDLKLKKAVQDGNTDEAKSCVLKGANVKTLDKSDFVNLPDEKKHQMTEVLHSAVAEKLRKNDLGHLKLGDNDKGIKI